MEKFVLLCSAWHMYLWDSIGLISILNLRMPKNKQKFISQLKLTLLALLAKYDELARGEVMDSLTVRGFLFKDFFQFNWTTCTLKCEKLSNLKTPPPYPNPS